MYDIYRWWVQNPESRVGKKSLFLLKTEQGTSHNFDRLGDAMYDIYRWWVQNPDSRGGKKSYGFSVVMGGVVCPLNKSWD